MNKVVRHRRICIFECKNLIHPLTMRKMRSVFFLMILLVGYGSVAANPIVLTGIYQGKDLYIKNPFSASGVGYCVYEVHVNGELSRDEINSSAFAIDFNVLGIEIGDEIEIIIKHKEGCTPVILNPESIKPHSTFEIAEIGVNNNVLTWTTTNESGSLPYIIEQFKWNKWVKAGEVPGMGTAGNHEYNFKLTPYSGENKVRLKQVDYTDKPRYSKSIAYNPKIAVVQFEPKRADGKIKFTSGTGYEIFNMYGKLVKTGYGNSVDIADLDRGEYYLNYDSSFGETFRKK